MTDNKIVERITQGLTGQEIEDFLNLIRKHSLGRKAVIHLHKDGLKITLTLIPLVKNEDEKVVPFPNDFMEEIISLARRQRKILKKSFYGKKGKFEIQASPQPKTIREARRAQRVWDSPGMVIV